MKKIEFLEKARNKHGYKYEYIDLSEKITLKDKIKLSYNDELYNQTVSKHLMGRCPEKASKRKTTEDFIRESKLIWGDKYDYSLTEYNGSLNNVKIIYDGIIYEQRASSHLDGMMPEFRKNKEYVLKDLIRSKNMYGISKIEKFLLKNKIRFIKKYSVKIVEFDFYLPNTRTCINFKGRHHYEPIERIGGEQTLNKIIKYDKNKDIYCEDNFINMINIKYSEYNDIENILSKNIINQIKI